MSYSKYYKEHGPSWINVSMLEIFKLMDISKTKKYLPIYVNFFRSRLDEFEVSYTRDGDMHYIYETVEQFMGKEVTSELSFGELLVFYRFIDNMDREKIKVIGKFCEFNEKGYFPGLDTSKITNYEDIEGYVSQLEIKEAEKKYAKQAPKVFESENWMVVRPISYDSSLKYGATTKWCTASLHNFDHFFNYTNKGALFYILSRKTHYKVALFIPLNSSEDGPSFWNQVDTRVDSMSLDFDDEIKTFLKSVINDPKILTNRELDKSIWYSSKNRSEQKGLKKTDIQPVRQFMDRETPIDGPELELEETLEVGEVMETQIGEEVAEHPILTPPIRARRLR